MKAQPVVLVPQLQDRAGRTVYNVHQWPESGRCTEATVLQQPVLGQIRMIPGNDSVDPVAEWSAGFDFGDEAAASDETVTEPPPGVVSPTAASTEEPDFV